MNLAVRDLHSRRTGLRAIQPVHRNSALQRRLAPALHAERVQRKKAIPLRGAGFEAGVHLTLVGGPDLERRRAELLDEFLPALGR